MSSTNVTRRLPIWEQPIKPKKVVFKLNSSRTISKTNMSAAPIRSKTNQVMGSNPRSKDMKPALKYKPDAFLNQVVEKFSDKLVPVTTIKLDRSATSSKNERLKTKSHSQRYRFLNEGIIDQCRKWERLHERALALEKHKKILEELRWKMALSNGSKRSSTAIKE